MGHLLFLLLPVLVFCSIEVDINYDKSSGFTVSLSGEDANVITEKERFSFQLNDDVIKRAVKKHSGGEPSDVYLHSPTPWDDLYKKYNWTQVQRVLTPLGYANLNVNVEKVVIDKQISNNTSTVHAKFNTDEVNLRDVFETKWYTGGHFDVQEKLEFYLQSNLIVDSYWGRNFVFDENVTFTPDEHTYVVNDKHTLETALIVEKVSVTILVEYVSKLVGRVAVNYDSLYKDHHFYDYDINALLKAIDYPTKVSSAQLIHLQFYTDAKVVVKDVTSNEIVAEEEVNKVV